MNIYREILDKERTILFDYFNERFQRCPHLKEFSQGEVELNFFTRQQVDPPLLHSI